MLLAAAIQRKSWFKTLCQTETLPVIRVEGDKQTMLIREVQEVYECIDRPGKAAADVAALFPGSGINIETEKVTGDKGETEFIRITIPGSMGKSQGGDAPTLGIIGRLGGLGARPAVIGFVSDGDGALAALSTALKLARMYEKGDRMMGDIIISTHICTNAPVLPRNPVPFMDSPVELSVMNSFEVSSEMDAILSIDTSRGNKLVNKNGYAITPTVKQGWILKVADDLLQVMEYTTGEPPTVFPITMQDITPYGNNVYHFNSLMQPAIATDAPLVGIALTSTVPVPGCATGVTNPRRIEEVGRYVIECAQLYGAGKLDFYCPEEFAILQKLYGDMSCLQSIPIN